MICRWGGADSTVGKNARRSRREARLGRSPEECGDRAAQGVGVVSEDSPSSR